MKKSKFLFLVPSVALATYIPCIGSCAKPSLTFKDIEDAIFNPVEEKHMVAGTFVEQLKLASKKDLQKELIYRLFAPSDFWATDLRDLYNDGLLNMFTNIQTCKIQFENEEVKASFAGYVNFVFKKDTEVRKKNDIIQVTFLFDNREITPENENWFLKLRLTQEEEERGLAFGFIEQIFEGERQLPFVIKKLDPRETIPNWHHWTNE